MQEIAQKIFRFRGQPITDSLETRRLKNWVITDGYNSIITVPILTDKDTLVGCLAIEQEVRKEIKRTPYRDLKDRVGLALTWPKVLLKLAFSKSYRTQIRAEMERQQSRIKMKERC